MSHLLCPYNSVRSFKIISLLSYVLDAFCCNHTSPYLLLASKPATTLVEKILHTTPFSKIKKKWKDKTNKITTFAIRSPKLTKFAEFAYAIRPFQEIFKEFISAMPILRKNSAEFLRLTTTR